MAETARPQCVQFIYNDNGLGTRQCRRTATHVYPNNERIVTCSQHARAYDVPMPKTAR